MAHGNTARLGSSVRCAGGVEVMRRCGGGVERNSCRDRDRDRDRDRIRVRVRVGVTLTLTGGEARASGTRE